MLSRLLPLTGIWPEAWYLPGQGKEVVHQRAAMSGWPHSCSFKDFVLQKQLT